MTETGPAGPARASFPAVHIPISDYVPPIPGKEEYGQLKK